MSSKFRRRKRKAGRHDGEQYMTLSYPMLQSAAWRSLSGAACKVWLELRTRYDGGNNGRLKLSLDEAARLLGLGKATVQRALAELMDKGFVTMTTRGQWYGRQASTWATADKGVNGAMPTYAWKAWQPPPKKRPLGSLLEPADGMTVPWQNRGDAFGSIPEPVSMVAAPSIGSQADRYYYHGGGGEGGREAEAQSIAGGEPSAFNSNGDD